MEYTILMADPKTNTWGWYMNGYLVKETNVHQCETDWPVGTTPVHGWGFMSWAALGVAIDRNQFSWGRGQKLKSLYDWLWVKATIFGHAFNWMGV